MHELFERILVPLDGSARSLATVSTAVQLAKEQHSFLVFLFVADISIRDLLAGLTKRPREAVQQEQEENGRRYLNHAAGLAEKEGVPCERVLRVGMTSAEITALAQARGATLIVVAKPVQHEIRGLFESRVLREIIENPCCSVLVLTGRSL